MSACLQCGSEERVSVRESDDGDVSEPLCANCWYEYDHQADRIYCAMQSAFYEEPGDDE